MKSLCTRMECFRELLNAARRAYIILLLEFVIAVSCQKYFRIESSTHHPPAYCIVFVCNGLCETPRPATIRVDLHLLTDSCLNAEYKNEPAAVFEILEMLILLTPRYLKKTMD